MGKKTLPAAAPKPTAPFHNPFAALGRQGGEVPQKMPAAAPACAAQREVSVSTEAKSPIRAVIRLEKKGRRGKEVTLVEKLELSDAECARWLKELKQTLGTGGAVESGTLVLQGDHRQRLQHLLAQRRVRRISMG